MGCALPSPQTTNPRDRWLQRSFEILPGALTWTTFVGLFLLSFINPVAAAVVVIAYDLYWLIRVAYFTVFMVLAYGRLRDEWYTDWLARCEDTIDPVTAIANLGRGPVDPWAKSAAWGWRRRARRSRRRHIQQMGELLTRPQTWMDWRQVYHLVLLPTYGESADILRTSVQALAEQSFPRNRMMIILCLEEREGEQALVKAAQLQGEFEGTFMFFGHTLHPDGIVGEAKVKGANMTNAAKIAREFLLEWGVPFDEILVSAFDADTRAHPQYLAYLTFAFVTEPNRLRRSYQPLPMYNNNIWEAPAFSRVAANSTTFWQMVQSVRPDMLITFSSHSMPFPALVEAGYWPVDVISDDSVIYYSCMLAYEGDYSCVPMFIPVYMDANLGPTYWKTFRNLYKQMRRWAWGVEKLPLMVRGFLADRHISAAKKLTHVFRMVEGNYSWGTASFILMLLGWLPLFFGGGEFHRSVISYHLPIVSHWIMSLALTGLLFSAFMCLRILPPRPPGHSRWKPVLMFLQWALVPIYFIFLVAAPAVDAQTRLMLGAYLTFWVTEKRRAATVPASEPLPRPL